MIAKAHDATPRCPTARDACFLAPILWVLRQGQRVASTRAVAGPPAPALRSCSCAWRWW